MTGHLVSDADPYVIIKNLLDFFKILSRIWGLRDEYNGFWIRWSYLLAPLLPLLPIITAHN
jgi:hypothetical protein